MSSVYNKKIASIINDQYADSINMKWFMTLGTNAANGTVSGEGGTSTSFTYSEQEMSARAYRGTKGTVDVQRKGVTDKERILTPEEFHTEPLRITHKQKKLKPYDISMVSKGFLANDLAEQVSNYVAASWMPTVKANIIETTGASRNSVLKDNPTISGTRKKLTEADLYKLLSLGWKAQQYFGGGSLNVMVNNYWLEDLLAIDNMTLFDKTGVARLKELPFAQQPLNIGGINWVYVSNKQNQSNTQYRASLTTPTVADYHVANPSVIATDRGAMLAWVSRAVLKAVDAVDFNISTGIVGTENSDEMDFHTLALAGILRSDNAGVYAIVE